MKRKEFNIDWKILAGIDLDNFQEQIDKKRLHVFEITEMISNCKIENEFDLSAVDHHFIKVFRLSQELLKYTLNESKRMKARENESRNECNVIEENKKLRRLLKTYQRAFSFADIDVNSDYMQCPHCPKAFTDIVTLTNHISRRHPRNSLEAEGTFSLTNKISEYNSALFSETKVLKNVHKELEEIKEKLNFTELALTEEKEERKRLEEKMGSEIAHRVEEIQGTIKENEELQTERVLNQLKNDFRNQLIEANLKTVDSDDEQQHLPETNDTKTLQHILVNQTNEVQRIGSNIEKLVQLLASKEEIKAIKLHPTVMNATENISGNSQVKNNKVEILKELPLQPPAKPARLQRDPIIRQRRVESDSAKIDRSEISAKLDEELKQLGVNGNDISNEQYNDVMKQLFNSRKTKSSYKELQKLIDIKASIELSKREVLGRIENHEPNKSDLSSPTVDDESKVVVVYDEPKPAVKSVLRKHNAERKPKRNIRFSDRNILISPESSDEDDKSVAEQTETKKPEDYIVHENVYDVDLTESDESDFEKDVLLKANVHKTHEEQDESLKNKPSVEELTKVIEEKLSASKRPGSGRQNHSINNEQRGDMKTSVIS